MSVMKLLLYNKFIHQFPVDIDPTEPVEKRFRKAIVKAKVLGNLQIV